MCVSIVACCVPRKSVIDVSFERSAATESERKSFNPLSSHMLITRPWSKSAKSGSREKDMVESCFTSETGQRTISANTQRVHAEEVLAPSGLPFCDRSLGF